MATPTEKNRKEVKWIWPHCSRLMTEQSCRNTDMELDVKMCFFSMFPLCNSLMKLRNVQFLHFFFFGYSTTSVIFCAECKRLRASTCVSLRADHTHKPSSTLAKSFNKTRGGNWYPCQQLPPVLFLFLPPAHRVFLRPTLPRNNPAPRGEEGRGWAVRWMMRKWPPAEMETLVTCQPDRQDYSQPQAIRLSRQLATPPHPNRLSGTNHTARPRTRG